MSKGPLYIIVGIRANRVGVYALATLNPKPNTPEPSTLTPKP